MQFKRLVNSITTAPSENFRQVSKVFSVVLLKDDRRYKRKNLSFSVGSFESINLSKLPTLIATLCRNREFCGMIKNNLFKIY
jgi:hypothetical protein